ncbi:protein ALP1-like [Leguminivora glycinivorella]|uniref:protein ALP1-like n=1 Tax=Leguminivora glycinivorella TaxID=1035111 RepID=UPI00200FDE1A|nr:protein ALP1-like [Leguminivora glycinivorella]XP_047998570.1 protein ALP1-like [Leguminivora glycinivorella]
MSVKSFDELLSLICTKVYKKDTNYRRAIEPEERLAVTLRYLATGASFGTLSEDLLMGKSTISAIVCETCSVLWEILMPLELPQPTEEMWINISNLFYTRTNYPNCLGPIDGKHVRIRKPAHSGSNFFNYKKFFSIVLFALADANCLFTAVDIGSCGREADSNIFKNSNMGKMIALGQLNIPKSAKLPNSSGPEQPYVFLGDEAFSLKSNLMRPYPNRNLTIEQRTYNFRHSRARRCVECAFGILSNKWRVLHSSINTDVKNAIKIIQATCVLHNFVRRREGINFKDQLRTCTLRDVRTSRLVVSTSGQRVREFYKEYFVNEGRLNWQNRYI